MFGGEPTLILLDELSVYLRKVSNLEGARDQLTAFLTSLFKAVEGTPNAALVYTLAIGKDGRATDAYNEENQFIADNMAEAESVSARKATLLNPTEEDETVLVLRRRLFESIDETRAGLAIEAYRELWTAHRDSLVGDAARFETVEIFRSSYPLHPEVLETLTGKTATLGNFQRVRGMLRLLARAIAHLWEEQPRDATAIHLHHIDPGHEPIRQEIVTRLGQTAYVPAIANDVAAEGTAKKALAQEIDAEHHGGLPPYVVYAARTIFLHTLAFNDPLKGLSPERLRYSLLGPAMDITFIEEARKKFIAESAYLDDRPGAPMRFLAEANLRQVIRREERHVDAGLVSGSRYALGTGIHPYKSWARRLAPSRPKQKEKALPMPSPTDRISYRAADQNRQADAATPDATLHAARPGDAARRRARRGPGSGLHGAAARTLFAAAHQPQKQARVQARQRAIHALHGGWRRQQTALRHPAASAAGVGVHRSGADAITRAHPRRFALGVHAEGGHLQHQRRQAHQTSESDAAAVWMHGLAHVQEYARGSHTERADCPSHGVLVERAPTGRARYGRAGSSLARTSSTRSSAARSRST